MRAAVALLVLLALAPSADAAWAGPGGIEPDTPEDATHGSMWPDPGTTPGHVYFNGFLAYAQTALNPNTGLVGSRILPGPATHHQAMLGVWLDCNRDGYVGAVESGLQEYRAELLAPRPDALCPIGSPHNDGLWVSELLGIGMVDPCERTPEAPSCDGVDAFAPNERALYLDGTTVWADEGGPDDAPRGTCAVAPLPRGTTSGSGLLLRYADCHSGHAVARSVNAIDADGGLGLAFDDPTKPHESDSALNRPFPANLFGGSGRDGLLERDAAPTASVWDCSARKGTADVTLPLVPDEAVVTDPTPGQLLTGRKFPLVVVDGIKDAAGLSWAPRTYFVDEDADPETPGTVRVALADDAGSHAWAPALAPAVADDPANASLWSAAGALVDGARGDCDLETSGPLDPAHPGASVERGDATIAAGARDRNDAVFLFYDGHRGLHPDVDPVTGATTPSDGGVLYRRHDRGGAGPLWTAPEDGEQTPLLLDRDALGTESRRFTYYARLGDAWSTLGLSPPAGSVTFLYGGESCEDTFVGERNGWICDAEAWWDGADGASARPAYRDGTPLGAVPGDAYHLRDVDCYDGRVAAQTPTPAARACGTVTGPAAFVAGLNSLMPAPPP